MTTLHFTETFLPFFRLTAHLKYINHTSFIDTRYLSYITYYHISYYKYNLSVLIIQPALLEPSQEHHQCKIESRIRWTLLVGITAARISTCTSNTQHIQNRNTAAPHCIAVSWYTCSSLSLRVYSSYNQVMQLRQHPQATSPGRSPK